MWRIQLRNKHKKYLSIGFAVLIIISCSKKDTVGSFYDAVEKADIVIAIQKTSYTHAMLKHYDIELEYEIYKDINFPRFLLYEPQYTDLGYMNGNTGMKFSIRLIADFHNDLMKRFNNDITNGLLNKVENKSEVYGNVFISPKSPEELEYLQSHDFQRTLKDAIIDRYGSYFDDNLFAELLYVSNEFKRYCVSYSFYKEFYRYNFIGNTIGTKRKLKKIEFGDTLLIALKRMTKKNVVKGKEVTITEYPKGYVFVPFEDCTSFVRIHGDMCYGQFDHPYSITEPEKYPFKHEVYPVKDVIDKIKRIKGIK